MSYIVLARKYRPQNFKDLVGQDPVSQTLVNAIESGRTAHAYVFSGPRGVGKTTTARILAMCLNCQKGTSINPCHECPSCLSIAQGQSVDDVLEIDGASNRGIEQIRELRENAKYSPSSSRYRIYIIDEAHQITKDAFGALLKILEEPPAHVIFMMATTEVQKIPAPILSRCQRFSLRPISPDRVLAHLKKICAAEKISVEEEALADIVRFVEGSMRDALSLLDQALVFSPGKITAQSLRDLLGLLPAEVVRNFAEALRRGDPAAILQEVNQCAKDGIDLTQLGKDLQNYFHSLLLAKAGVQDALILSSKNLAKEAEPYDFPTLERNIRLLSKALEDIRRSETPRALFEVYALRMGQKVFEARELLDRLEKLEKSGPVSKPAAPAPTFSVKEREPLAPRAALAAKVDMPIPTPEPERAVPLPASSSLTDFLSQWDNWVQEISQLKNALGGALDDSTPTVQGSTLILTFSNSFNQQLVTRSMELLMSSLAKRIVGPVTIETSVQKTADTRASTPGASPVLNVTTAKAIQEEAKSDYEDVKPDGVGPDIQKALKHFPGAMKREKHA